MGVLGIIIKDNYRDIGIGTKMLETLILQAKNMGLRILTLTVFSTNKRAKHVYEKVGFKETGRIPKDIFKNGKFIDQLIMVKDLKSK